MAVMALLTCMLFFKGSEDFQTCMIFCQKNIPKTTSLNNRQNSIINYKRDVFVGAKFPNHLRCLCKNPLAAIIEWHLAVVRFRRNASWKAAGKFNDCLCGVCNKELTDVLLHQVQKEKNIHRCTESADQNGSVLNPSLINWSSVQNLLLYFLVVEIPMKTIQFSNGTTCFWHCPVDMRKAVAFAVCFGFACLEPIWLTQVGYG